MQTAQDMSDCDRLSHFPGFAALVGDIHFSEVLKDIAFLFCCCFFSGQKLATYFNIISTTALQESSLIGRPLSKRNYFCYLNYLIPSFELARAV